MESAVDSGVGSETEIIFDTDAISNEKNGEKEDGITKCERTPEQNDNGQIDNSIFNTISKIVNPAAKVKFIQ